MNKQKVLFRIVFAAAMLSGLWLAIPKMTSAHCDTMEGPVVATARQALEKGDVTPVLKWVRKEYEKEIRDLFQKTLVVRKKGKEAKDLADMYFFETLVRIHRAGEGASYTGLKSEPAEPIIQAADKSLESGSADNLVKHVAEAVAKGISERFKRTLEAQKHADESIDAGREYVESYVEFTHYVERLYADADAQNAPHEGMIKGGIEGHRRH